MPNEIIPYNNKLKTLARELRNNSTLSEVLLWKQIKGKSFGVEFHRQVPMLNYIVDFYCHEIKLVIEIDGSSHDTEKAFKADKKRQKEIEQYGITFLRIDDIDVKRQMNNVLRAVEDKIDELQKEHPPASRPIGAGVSKGDKKDISNLQYITQPIAGKSTAELVREVCDAGVKWIQLRLKNADAFVWEQVAIEVWEVCQDMGVVFIINDNVDVAKRVMADGVHLGKQDMKPSEARKILGEDVIIGGTANTFEDIQFLAAEGVDYIGLGPFTFTTTKDNLSPQLGLIGYQQIVEQCQAAGIQIPMVAIGGIKEEDVLPIMEAGMHGIAVSGLISHTANKKQVVNNIVHTLNTFKMKQHG